MTVSPPMLSNFQVNAAAIARHAFAVYARSGCSQNMWPVQLYGASLGIVDWRGWDRIEDISQGLGHLLVG
jgi:hypothetical protein